VAHRLHLVLEAAGKLKGGEARDKVRGEGVPLWLRLAPEVRRAMLDFQRIVATRNDLGTLASLHNKFVRLALVRLRLSIKEYLGELPPETETLFGQVTRPDPQAPARLIVPTRPTLLGKGERVRILAVVIGASESQVALHTRLGGTKEFSASPASLLGRSTYQVTLGPFSSDAEFVDYYLSAGKLVAPPGAPEQVYSATLLS
jgi:hypothetical protein